MPERIQLSRRRGWRKPEGTISVARPTPYGNPFAVGVRVPVSWVTGATYRFGWIEAETRAEAVAYYRDWMNGVVDVATTPKAVRPDVMALRGHDLACWCPPGEPCHAEVLLELASAGSEGASNG